MSQRLHVLVGGRVQAVGFRDFVRREARRLGVSGWVANLPDGRVEIVAEGPAAALETLTSLLRGGPPMAAVAGMEIARGEPTGEFDGFTIRSHD